MQLQKERAYKMLITYKKLNKTYGGYDYLEIDTDRKVYSTGCSRGHRGHGSSTLCKNEWMQVKVPTVRELEEQIRRVNMMGFTDVGSMYEYHEGLKQSFFFWDTFVRIFLQLIYFIYLDNNP